jgi:hypothetical protein
MRLKNIRGVVTEIKKYKSNNEVIKEYKIKLSPELTIEQYNSYMVDVIEDDFRLGQELEITLALFNDEVKIDYKIVDVKKV